MLSLPSNYNTAGQPSQQPQAQYPPQPRHQQQQQQAQPPPHELQTIKRIKLAADPNSSLATSSHVCHICKRVYERADHLTRHLRSHENARPYQCSRCPKRFNRAYVYSKHVVTGPCYMMNSLPTTSVILVTFSHDTRPPTIVILPAKNEPSSGGVIERPKRVSTARHQRRNAMTRSLVQSVELRTCHARRRLRDPSHTSPKTSHPLYRHLRPQ